MELNFNKLNIFSPSISQMTKLLELVKESKRQVDIK